MLPDLPQTRHSVSRRFGVISLGSVMTAVLVQLFGPVRTIEFMTLTRNAQQRNGHKQQQNWFHRRAT